MVGLVFLWIAGSSGADVFDFVTEYQRGPDEESVHSKRGETGSVAPASETDSLEPVDSSVEHVPLGLYRPDGTRFLVDFLQMFPKELVLLPVLFLAFISLRWARRRFWLRGGRSPASFQEKLWKACPSEVAEGLRGLGSAEFEALVAFIYHHQGYRVLMPAGLGGGRCGDFVIERPSDRALVFCKRFPPEEKVSLERVRDARAAARAAGADRALLVVTCDFTGEACKFAKLEGVTLINAALLNAQVIATEKKTGCELLKTGEWMPEFLGGLEFAPPECPACGASMDHVNSGSGRESVWLCPGRPACRGRRIPRPEARAAGKAEPLD